MPYYLYKISSVEGAGLVRNLELLDQFDAFKPAKTRAKELRLNSPQGNHIFKVMFAENQLSAEELLMEKREKPVLMEHER